jgi:hypothetical protein
MLAAGKAWLLDVVVQLVVRLAARQQALDASFHWHDGVGG